MSLEYKIKKTFSKTPFLQEQSSYTTFVSTWKRQFSIRSLLNGNISKFFIPIATVQGKDSIKSWIFYDTQNRRSFSMRTQLTVFTLLMLTSFYFLLEWIWNTYVWWKRTLAFHSNTQLPYQSEDSWLLLSLSLSWSISWASILKKILNNVWKPFLVLEFKTLSMTLSFSWLLLEMTFFPHSFVSP